mmetsp:Transcript_17928/g.24082  ORF Transcript_17928/g.24082 Transcript_17928/m.24082 type:complete len:85 (-) Transcript_17928:492-746(-)|eukprot:CAMPEP_0185572902 /NCGR_PEP_ID=MMETSP0434-20130131/4753_1 /TAXON_ID=626734 ORGANISM="Favella taraikaensis, Strain Fe Narragansett Bay" /NCGR_SAMPLE_ID=MMETSP0434 /ASSEMBLY_ACC=CAM_ASM_000379 /LENGTH=84 /DNA_ID=CAMNT_0028188955 /DNA_START=191 /DNA_END=445 /DNA_ORIENTATION=+
MVSESMELNGYEFEDFEVRKSSIHMPDFKTQVEQGELILNLYDGKKQLFKPMDFRLHAPSEHTLNGQHFDAELQILHHYKGTDE